MIRERRLPPQGYLWKCEECDFWAGNEATALEHCDIAKHGLGLCPTPKAAPELIDLLPPLHRRVVQLRWSTWPESTEAIAVRLGISREHVRRCDNEGFIALWLIAVLEGGGRVSPQPSMPEVDPA